MYTSAIFAHTHSAVRRTGYVDRAADGVSLRSKQLEPSAYLRGTMRREVEIAVTRGWRDEEFAESFVYFKVVQVRSVKLRW